MPVTIDGSNTPTAGGVGYGDGTELAFTTAGSAGQVLQSNGAGAPTWAAVPTVNLATGVTGTLPVGNGGTGQTSLTSNNVILGNGGSAVQFVAPGTTGNVLTSNGTTWTSAAASGGLTLLSSVTASSSSTVELETGIGSSYDFYLVTFHNVAPNTNFRTISVRLKINGSYQTSNYSYVAAGASAAGTTIVNVRANSGAASLIPLVYDQTNNAPDETSFGTVHFSNPTSTSSYKGVYYNGGTTMPSSGPYATMYTGSGYYTGSLGALTGIQFLFSSGTIVSGTFRLYGYAK